MCLPNVRFSSHDVSRFSASKEERTFLSGIWFEESPEAHLWLVLQALASSETTIFLGRLYLNSLIAPSVLGIRPTDVQPLRPSVSIDTQRSLMVVAGVQCVPRFTHCASRSNSPPHGRLSPRMGSALGRVRHLRTMESRGIGETHQSSRVGRCGQSLRNV